MLQYQRADFSNVTEMRFIAEADSRIPLEYDSHYTFTDASIDQRLKYYQDFKADDFFDVALDGSRVVGFHAVHIIPYPPDLSVGNIATLWVDPDYRKKGIAKQLKGRAENWGREKKLVFLQTNVHTNNKKMMAINQAAGFDTAYIHLRKRL
jgi:GNAT superfamily N-acetyltransferase